MTVNFLINKSEKNAVNKSTENVVSLSGTLKEETSIINPVITVEYSSNTIFNANYLYIPDFKRYYFMNDMVVVSNKLLRVSCHVDVLMSFKDSILKNSAIISRQENDWNLYLNDGSFKTYQNPYIVTKSFPTGFNTQQFVLVVAGMSV